MVKSLYERILLFEFKTDYNNFERKNQWSSKYYMTKYLQGIKTINRTSSLCFYF